MLTDILACILTGIPHSGTTILLDTLKQDSNNFQSGFECGLLFTDSLKDFEHRQDAVPVNLRKNLKESWKLTTQSFLKITNSKSYKEAYFHLQQDSSVVSDHCVRLIDKCPDYLQNIYAVANRSETVPILVIKKDPRNQIASLMHRGGSSFDHAVWRYNNENIVMLEEAKRRYSNRIYDIWFEDFVRYPKVTIQEIYRFLKIPFDQRAFYFSNIKSELCQEYKKYLNLEQQSALRDRFHIKYFNNDIE